MKVKEIEEDRRGERYILIFKLMQVNFVHDRRGDGKVRCKISHNCNDKICKTEVILSHKREARGLRVNNNKQ